MRLLAMAILIVGLTLSYAIYSTRRYTIVTAGTGGISWVLDTRSGRVS